MTSDLPAPYAAPIDNKDGDSTSVRCYDYEHIVNWWESVRNRVSYDRYTVAGPEENHTKQTPWLLSGVRCEHGMSRSCKSVKFIFNPLKPNGHCMYRQFNIQQFYVLPTQCIYVFCVDLRTNSDYFPTQH